MSKIKYLCGKYGFDKKKKIIIKTRSIYKYRTKLITLPPFPETKNCKAIKKFIFISNKMLLNLK